MKTLSFLICAAVLFLTQISSAQDKAASSTASSGTEANVINMEKAVWEAWKNKQTEAFKKSMASDYVGVYDEGVKTADKEMADMPKADLQSYSISDTKVTFPDADVAVITYKVAMKGTMAGKDFSGNYNSSSVWMKKGENWVTILHTEVKAH